MKDRSTKKTKVVETHPEARTAPVVIAGFLSRRRLTTPLRKKFQTNELKSTKACTRRHTALLHTMANIWDLKC